jgi:hypothetical protein
MKFEFYTCRSEEITVEVIDSLWNQDVCMDDWDYMLFFEAKFNCEFPEGWDAVTLVPDYHIDRLLTGCCSNKWYPVENFMGKKGFLGMAYHA